MEFLFEFLAEIVVEVLVAVINFWSFKHKKSTQKKFDVITRSILKRQAIKRTNSNGTHKRKIQN